MCGFVGIISKNQIYKREWLKTGSNAMHHRGPDDSGEWWSRDSRVGFAHRRLSIRDLSVLGRQPMSIPNLGLTLVFNGEIYNFKEVKSELIALGYRFVSESDTEVLLYSYAAWGTSCLERLNGMFAFALFDDNNKKLFLARDRAGEKPLFYRVINGTLQFASELKALLANPDNPRLINRVALDCYLAMGYVPGEQCILQGFNKLPPAHAMIFDLNSSQTLIWRYWKLPDCESPSQSLSDEDLLDEFESHLDRAVRSQIIADVPVGVLLSGGVDSSLITAMAVRASQNVKTYTVGFPGHGKYNEIEHARLIARHFGTEHNELMADDATADLLPLLASQFDEPLVDSSMIPTFLVSRLVGKHCKVALGGDGGDELFGGYHHYSRLLWMQQKLKWIPEFLNIKLANAAMSYLPVGFKGRNFALALAVNLNKGLPLIALNFDLLTRRKLLKAYHDWSFAAEGIWNERVPSSKDLLHRATQMDFENYMAEDILVKVDRASMLNSLEMRAPMLDYRLIEFAYSKVPSRLKATSKDKKILLKNLTRRLLPQDFDRQRKQGFSIPLNVWLKRGAFANLFNEVLRDPDCSFDLKIVDTLMLEQKKGYNNSEKLFSLVMFELWQKQYAAYF